MCSLTASLLISSLQYGWSRLLNHLKQIFGIDNEAYHGLRPIFKTEDNLFSVMAINVHCMYRQVIWPRVQTRTHIVCRLFISTWQYHLITWPDCSFLCRWYPNTSCFWSWSLKSVLQIFDTGWLLIFYNATIKKNSLIFLEL